MIRYEFEAGKICFFRHDTKVSIADQLVRYQMIPTRCIVLSMRYNGDYRYVVGWQDFKPKEAHIWSVLG